MVPDLLTPAEAAKRLAISVKQLRALTNSGDLRWVNIGGGLKRPTRRYKCSDLDEFIEQRTMRSVAVPPSSRARRTPHPVPHIVDFNATLQQLKEERRRAKEKGKRK